MHALSLARKRIRARIQHPATPRPVRLAHGLVEKGQSRFLPILSSPLAQEIISSGYDASTLDRVYANRPSGGLVARLADRAVLDLPLHQGLRERYDATVGEICAAVVPAVRAGHPEFRVLFAGCGLASEMVGVAERLRDSRPEVLSRLRCWGVDPDLSGALLPEAARRARAAGVRAEFIQEDLRRHREVEGVTLREGPFDLVSCVGVTQLHLPEEVADLVRFYSRLLAPGGTLLIDRWQGEQSGPPTDGIGIRMRSWSAHSFQTMLRDAGLVVEREHATGEGGCVLTVARKPASIA